MEGKVKKEMRGSIATSCNFFYSDDGRPFIFKILTIWPNRNRIESKFDLSVGLLFKAANLYPAKTSKIVIYCLLNNLSPFH